VGRQSEGADLPHVQHPAQEPQEAVDQGGVDQELRRPGHDQGLPPGDAKLDFVLETCPPQGGDRPQGLVHPGVEAGVQRTTPHLV